MSNRSEPSGLARPLNFADLRINSPPQQIVAFGAKTWLPQIAVISGVNWARDLTSVIIPTRATGKIAPVALQLRQLRA